jgi:hypothetical protein
MVASFNSSHLLAGLAIIVSSVLVKVGAFPSMSVKRGLTNVFSTIQDATTRAIFGRETVTMKGSFYDIVDVDMAGNKVPMSSFKNDVLLVVNVASKCGLTDRNYSQLSKLAEEYGPRGLKILAFPCNQFMGQEPVRIQFIMCASIFYIIEQFLMDILLFHF